MVVLLGFCGRSAGPFLSFQRVSHASVVLCAVGNSAGPFPFSISLTNLAVLLLQAGRRMQIFILLFSEPGVCGFADPCMRFIWAI